MAYFAPYVDAAGLHIPTYADIRDDLIAKFQEIYGSDIYLENDSQDYQMISAFSLKTYDTLQTLQLVYNNHSPKTSVGTALSSLVKLNGLQRKTASYSTCVLTLTGTVGTTIKAGIVEDDAGNLWDLPTNLVFKEETLETTAECETIGAIEAPVGTITKINTPQRGWLSVTNNVAAVKGNPVETDEELRERQTISVALPGRNMLDSTSAAIKALDEVARCRVYDNDTSETDENGIPSHSIAAVVEGGLDADIAEVIYKRKGPGGGTYGTTTVEYETADGLTLPICFFRPDYVAIDATIQIKAQTGYSDSVLDGIKESVESFLSGLDIGVDVRLISLLKAITDEVEDTSNPTFSLVSVTLGESGSDLAAADVEIAFNAVASLGTVTVEAVTT